MSASFFSLKKIFIFTPLLILVAGIIAFCLIPSTLYSGYLEAVISRALLARGINSKISGLEISPLRVSVKQASIAISPLFIVELQTLECRPSWLSLLGLNLHVECDANGYDGTIHGVVRHPLRGSGTTLRFQVNGIAIAKHPQLLGLGFTGGQLSASSDEFRFGSAGPIGKVRIEASKVIKPEDSFFSLPSAGLYLALPKVSDLNLTVNGDQAQDGSIRLQLSNSSSLGSANGLMSVRESRASGRIQVRLSDEAVQRYGQLVSMASSGTLAPGTSAFTLELSGTWPRVKAKIVP